MGRYDRGKRLLGLILVCSGAAILLMIILPFWAWLSLAALGLIWLGWVLLRKY